MDEQPKSCTQVLDFVSKGKITLFPLRAENTMKGVFQSILKSESHANLFYGLRWSG